MTQIQPQKVSMAGNAEIIFRDDKRETWSGRMKSWNVMGPFFVAYDMSGNFHAWPLEDILEFHILQSNVVTV